VSFIDVVKEKGVKPLVVPTVMKVQVCLERGVGYPDGLRKAEFVQQHCAIQQSWRSLQLCACVTDSCLTCDSASATVSGKLTRKGKKKYW
jgi:hypothetical protein